MSRIIADNWLPELHSFGTRVMQFLSRRSPYLSLLFCGLLIDAARSQVHIYPVDSIASPGLEWTYVYSVDSGATYGGVSAVHNDTILSNLFVPRSQNPAGANRYCVSTNLGRTWDTLPRIYGERDVDTADVKSPHFAAWEWVPPFMLQPAGLVWNRHDSDLYFIASHDFAHSWDTVGIFPHWMSVFMMEAQSSLSLARNPSDPERIVYLNVSVNIGAGGNIFARSLDGGRTWEPSPKAPPPLEGEGETHTFLFDQRDSRIWYDAVTPVINHSGPLVTQHWQTTDDGKSWMPIDQWAPLAGVGFAGELRAWSMGPQDRDGSKSQFKRIGFNSYLPEDPIDKTPTFTNVFEKIAPLKNDFKQTAGAGMIAGAELSTQIVGAEEGIDVGNYEVANYFRWLFLTTDDCKSLVPILSDTEVVSLRVEPQTFKFWITVSRRNSRNTSERPFRYDFFSSTAWAHLIKPKSRVETKPDFSPSISIFPQPLIGIVKILNVSIYAQLAGDASLSVVDCLGRILQQVKLNVAQAGATVLQLQLDSSIAPGVYFIKFDQGGSSRFRKVILE